MFNLLLEPIIFESIFSYHASSKTALTAEPAFRPVPPEAGISLTIQDLNFFVIAYGTVLAFVIGTSNKFLYASRDAFLTAIETSGHFETPNHILPFQFHIKIVALKDILLHQVVTLVTLLTSSILSSNSVGCLFSLSKLITKNYILKGVTYLIKTLSNHQQKQPLFNDIRNHFYQKLLFLFSFPTILFIILYQQA